MYLPIHLKVTAIVIGTKLIVIHICVRITGSSDIQWCFSQVKGTIEEEITDGMYYLAQCTHFLVPADAEQKEPNLMCVFFSSCASSYLLTMTAGYLVNGTGLLYYKPQL